MNNNLPIVPLTKRFAPRTPRSDGGKVQRRKQKIGKSKLQPSPRVSQPLAILQFPEEKRLDEKTGEPLAARKPRLSFGMRGWASGADKPRQITMRYQGTTLVSAVTAAFFTYDFQLDQFEGYADLVSVFDAYRLLRVKVTFVPRVNVQSLTTQAVTTTSGVPYLLSVIDYDDNTALTSMSDAWQYETCKPHGPFKQFSRTFKPRISMAAYQTGSPATLGYAQMDAETWIDAAYDDVQHYGLKIAISSTSASQTTFPQWYVFVEGDFEFRQPR